MTTRAEIGTWLKELYEPGSGIFTDANKKYSHMIVATDTFDYDDYPVFIEEGESVLEKVNKIDGDTFGRVMEVYSINHGFEDQMNERLARHYD